MASVSVKRSLAGLISATGPSRFYSNELNKKYIAPYCFILYIFLIQRLDVLFKFLWFLNEANAVVKIRFKSFNDGFNITNLEQSTRTTAVTIFLNNQIIKGK